MLVLTRSRLEKIILTLPSGDRVQLTVVDIRGDKVRLGIEAPDDVRIHRGEVQAAIDRGDAVDRRGG